ncbi:hypothetical protein DSECCO2_591540 [anaerobic digester metagenome]
MSYLGEKICILRIQFISVTPVGRIEYDFFKIDNCLSILLVIEVNFTPQCMSSTSCCSPILSLRPFGGQYVNCVIEVLKNEFPGLLEGASRIQQIHIFGIVIYRFIINGNTSEVIHQKEIEECTQKLGFTDYLIFYLYINIHSRYVPDHIISPSHAIVSIFPAVKHDGCPGSPGSSADIPITLSIISKTDIR